MHASSIMTGPYRLRRDSFHDTAYLIGRAEALRGERALNSCDPCLKEATRTPYLHREGVKERSHTVERE